MRRIEDEIYKRLRVRSADETWMIGDDIRSDVGGAQQAGLRGILSRRASSARRISSSK